MKKLGLSMILAAGLIGCDSDTEETANNVNSSEWSLTQSDWTLTQYGSETDSMEELLAETSYTLSFSETTNEVTGTINCNSFQLPYSTSDNDLILDNFASTEMLCNTDDDNFQQYLDQDSFITLALSTVESYELTEDNLTLYSVTGEILVYQALSIEPSEWSLTQNDWTLTQYGETDSMEELLAEASYTLSFSETTNEVTGTINCNSFQSSYSTSDNYLILDNVASTEMLCNTDDDNFQQYLEQDTFITSALSTIDSYELTDDNLTLYSTGGEILVYQVLSIE